MRNATLVLLLATIALNACRKENAASKIPEISLQSVGPTSIKAASEDELQISFSFKDGDADLGNFGSSSGLKDIYIRDSRVDTVQYNFYFPDLSGVIQDQRKGISGVCILPFQAAFLKLRPDHTILDTLTLHIFIKDKAGNKSNTIESPPIYLSK